LPIQVPSVAVAIVESAKLYASLFATVEYTLKVADSDAATEGDDTEAETVPVVGTVVVVVVVSPPLTVTVMYL
jgi:hypothetical protein